MPMTPLSAPSHERAFAIRSLGGLAIATLLVVAGLAWLPAPFRNWLLIGYLAACPVACVIWYRRLSRARELDAKPVAASCCPPVRHDHQADVQPVAEYTSAVES
jgi:hypothetical protein